MPVRHGSLLAEDDKPFLLCDIPLWEADGPPNGYGGLAVSSAGAADSSAGAEGFAGKKGGGGGTTSSGSTGTTSTTSSAPAFSDSATFKTVTVRWDPLDPPAGTALVTDPYYSKQWGLISIDVVRALQNYTGAGVRIGAIDDGFDYNHPDLKPHYLTALDYDARTGGNDPFGDPTADQHGTAVMGVFGAARDGSGIMGVAYDSGIAGYRIGYGTAGSASQCADALAHALGAGMDVVNNSWGYTTPYADNFYTSGFGSVKAALQSDAANGRGGLGISTVFAAGNGRSSGDDVNLHNIQNSPYVITVGATDPYNHVAAFSTPGAALLVSAPGSAYTDDRVGTAGYLSADYINISGTSFSAPFVSGIVALMLQANPDLGYRDVMEILAYSARNTDPGSVTWQSNGAHDWNGGGLHFSNDYGFGLVDAWAAVRLAESWQKQSTFANLSNVTVTHSDDLVIPDGSGAASSQLTVGYDLRLDKVLVELNITHAAPHDLTVTLTSPSGTSAVLASHPANGTGSGIAFEVSANTFWGENAHGTWTLSVGDSVAGTSGKLVGWTLQALGDAPDTPTVYVYTDEFAAAAGSGRGVLNDASGTAGINTAAVSSGSWLDLNPGAVDTIAGRSVTIGSGTLLKSAWGGDGNDTVIANGAGDLIEGGRGNDTIVAGAGADKLWGGPGSDTFVFKTPGPVDTIGDFAVAADLLDLRPLLKAIGYAGSNAAADGWVAFAATGSAAMVSVDAHTGLGLQAVVQLSGVAPDELHPGGNLLIG